MRKVILTLGCLAIATFVILRAADHVDAPAVGSLTEGSSVRDITDYYAFESPSNADNYVFVCNVAGLTAPSASVDFDEDVLYEFNIDTNGDNVEDQLIQVFFRDGMAITYGVVAATQTGSDSKITSGANRLATEVASMNSGGGIQLFAGPRDDPFFMDFFKFVEIVNGVGAALADTNNPGVFDPNRINPNTGEPYPAAFDDPGTDAFAGTNVLSIVVEVPKSAIGDTNGMFTSWVETKVRQ